MPPAATKKKVAKKAPAKHKLDERIIMPSFREKFHPFLNEKLDPSQVRGLLQSAFSGDPQSLNDLYVIMEDTWPRLAKNLHEIKKAASRADYVVQPFAEQGEEPTEQAQEKANFIRKIIDDMRPVPKRNENGFEDMIYDLCDAIGKGVSVQEVLWDIKDGYICPKSTYWVHPQFWGFDSTGIEIMLRNIDGVGSRGYHEMPDDKFLVGRYKTRSGNPLTYGFSRVLAFWWSGMIFGRQWLMRYAQIFGIPLRVAKYGRNLSDGDRNSLEAWLRDLAAAGYAMIPEGSEVQLLEASKGGSDNPQNHLIDVADRVCDILILGQTLTTDVGDSGSRALGDVHAAVRQDNLRDACDWAAQNVNDQIIRKAIRFNYGNTDELPYLQTRFDSAEDPVQMATRDQILVSMGMELPKDQMYERHKIRVPEIGEDVITAPAAADPFAGKEPIKAEEPKKKLNDPFRLPKGDGKKFGVYVKNDKGNTVLVKFGDPNMEIKRDSDNRRQNFRSRHNCEDPGPKWKARYWSCKMWEKGKTVQDVLAASDWQGEIEEEEENCCNESKVEAKAIPTKDDKLTDSVMEQLTGVNAEWLGPVRPIFDKMISLAESEEVSDEELKKAVETLAEEMPELFDEINHEALQEALEEAMGSAAANGAFERINDYNMDNPEDA